MTKPKTLEQLRADKERDRDAACTGTAQVGASGEQKEVSGDRLVTEKDGTAWVCYLRS